MLGLAKRTQGEDPAGLDQRGLRRPDRAPADGGLLGQRQPDRPALLLRRGQALRRDAVLRLPPPARHARSRSRASSTPTARACTRTTAAWSRTSSCRRCRATPITIYGDGSQTRSFCYVDDLVDGLIRLMDSPAEVVGPINLGNPGEFTMLELAEKVLEFAGGESKIDYKPLPDGRPEAAPARHRPRRRPTRVEPHRRPGRRPGPHGRLLPRPAHPGQSVDESDRHHQPSSCSRSSPIPKWWPTSWITVRRTISTTSSSVRHAAQMACR